MLSGQAPPDLSHQAPKQALLFHAHDNSGDSSALPFEMNGDRSGMMEEVSKLLAKNAALLERL
jgi:hypothetical protein